MYKDDVYDDPKERQHKEITTGLYICIILLIIKFLGVIFFFKYLFRELGSLWW